MAMNMHSELSDKKAALTPRKLLNSKKKMM